LCACDIYLRCFAAGATVWLRNFLPMKFKDMDAFSAPELTYMIPECSYLDLFCLQMVQTTWYVENLFAGYTQRWLIQLDSFTHTNMQTAV